MGYNNKQRVYLAALLHDIGKFWRQACHETADPLSKATLQEAESLCPKNDSNESTQRHTLFTYEFLNQNRSLFSGTAKRQAANVTLADIASASYKESPDQLERIIQYANIISAGKENEQVDISDNASLLNPFDNAYRTRDAAEKSYYPVKKLKFDNTIFARQDIENNTEQYQRLWKEFIQETKKLPRNNFSAQATTLLNLLRKYTWCVPASFQTTTDISLYDHLKTTAAIASCLYQSEQIEDYGQLPPLFDTLAEETKERFTLLVGDFSGIQRFIYQLSSKGAAKTLKGRSFYLQLLQDAVLDVIKQIFDIEDAHILMATGGRFQLLLPNNEPKLEEAQNFIGKVNLLLRRQFGDAIYLATGTKSFAAGRLMEDNGFSNLVEKAYDNVEQDKSRKFARQMDKDFFSPGPTAGTTADEVCHVTGIDLQKDQVKTIDDGLVVSLPVYRQIQLGRWLKNAAYIVKLRKHTFNMWDQELCPLHDLNKFFGNSSYERVTYRIYNQDQQKLTEDKYQELPQSERVIETIAINKTDFMRFADPDIPVAHSFALYGAAWTPDDVYDEENGGLRRVDFSDIAQDGSNDLMAVLRLDVDNLGRLFREGIGVNGSMNKQLGSISRFSSMSDKLDFFFAGYINHLITEKYKGKEVLESELISEGFENKAPNQYILPVYAGGDDVFILCRWDIAPQLAKRIYDDFDRFTNRHENISLSGGTRMVHGKYPIHKAALEAEQAEHKAKTFTTYSSDEKKDAFCMFGQAMSWQDFDLATDYVTQLFEWQEQMETKTLLNFLRQLYGEYDELHHYGRWRWRAAYQLKRIGKRYELEAEMSKLASWLFNGTLETLQGESKNFKRVEIIPKNEQPVINRLPEPVDLTAFTAQWLHQLTRTQKY